MTQIDDHEHMWVPDTWSCTSGGYGCAICFRTLPPGVIPIIASNHEHEFIKDEDKDQSWYRCKWCGVKPQ